MALANKTQEETNKENREHCKRIARDVEAYAEGRIYKCPECGEEFELYDMYGENFHINEEGNEIGKCPGCGYTSEGYNEFEQLSLYDYFSDCLDIEYRVSGKGRDDYRSVRIMVAFGGPNIYIDTASKAVELYWWTDQASYPLTHDVCDEIDDWASEMWACL